MLDAIQWFWKTSYTNISLVFFIETINFSLCLYSSFSRLPLFSYRTKSFTHFIFFNGIMYLEKNSFNYQWDISISKLHEQVNRSTIYIWTSHFSENIKNCANMFNFKYVNKYFFVMIKCWVLLKHQNHTIN